MYLTADEKKRFRKLAKILFSLNVTTRLDAYALANHIQTETLYFELMRTIEQEGATGQDMNGETTPHKCVRMVRDILQLMQRQMAEFGMTPASRTRIQALPSNTPHDADPWGDI